MSMSITYSDDVKKGERFEFGKNWARFLKVLTDERIEKAERSMQAALGMDSLAEKSFIDIGSGSGLFSLAAMRLGAKRVHSLDYDPNSVACTKELKRRYFPDASNWVIEQGSALDANYLGTLGHFDIVYSWGVLHHTGNMWLGLENAQKCVASAGKLYVAIYNDQGFKSKLWHLVKRVYNKNSIGYFLVISFFFPLFIVKGFLKDVFTLKNPMTRYREYKQERGMSIYYDWFDWLGGFPFEVATPDAITQFYGKYGFRLSKLIRRHGLGCNEFVFDRSV